MSRLAPSLLLALSACAAPAPEPTAPEEAAEEVPYEPVYVDLEGSPEPSARLYIDPTAVAVSQGLDAWLKDHAERRVYLQLDKPLYRPGETVWVQGWDLNPRGLEGRAGERPVTWQLLNPKGQIVTGALVRQVDGLASGALDIPRGSPGGIWRLRALSDDGVQTERELVVASYSPPRIRKELEFVREAYGPGEEVEARITVEGLGSTPLLADVRVDGEKLERVEAVTDAYGEATLRFRLPESLKEGQGVLTVMVEDGGIRESVSEAIPIVMGGVELSLRPEGGDLVLGLPSRVYFTAIDAQGDPADVAGRVLDDRGEVVARFKSVHDGLGRFPLTPEPGRRYRAVLDEPYGVDLEVPLPKAQREGCVLRSFDDLRGQVEALRVSVRCTTRQKVVVVGAQAGQTLDTGSVFAGPKAPAVVHLLSEDEALERAPGVARVTVLSDTLEPLAERLVYRNQRSMLQVGVTADRSQHGPRDKVSLRVTTTDPQGRPVPARLALSVVDDALLSYADDERPELLASLLLTPELPEEIHEPNFYFDPEEALAPIAMELLMGAKGWRRFDWRPLTQDMGVDTGEETEVEPPSVVNVEEEPPIVEEEEPPEAELAVRAKREEGKEGKRDAQVKRRELDKKIAENAGLLAAIGYLGAEGGAVEGVFAGADLELALGDLIGAKGGQLDGLGAMGQGIGGGGFAEGLGGLGTRGVAVGAGYGGGLILEGRRGTQAAQLRLQDPVILGALDRALVQAVVKRHANQLRYCHQRELQKTPELAGRVAVKFVIQPDGRVAQSNIRSSTLRSPEVERCLSQRFMRMRFPETKGGGIAIVTYPMELSPGEGGGLVAGGYLRQPAGPRYSPVRVFPAPRYTERHEGPRVDFRDTIYWKPDLQTDAEGVAEVELWLSDEVTTFRAVVEGVGGGLPGRGEAELRSELPFALDLRLPLELSAGDRVQLPLSVRNNRVEDVVVALATQVGELLVLDEGAERSFSIQGFGFNFLQIPLRAERADGETLIHVSAEAQGLKDGVRETVRVVPRGYPSDWAASGALADRLSHSIDLGEVSAGSLRASLRVFPNPLADLSAGLDGMLRQPRGCFEQTSSANYPNVLALQTMQAGGGGSAAAISKARGYLSEGYERLAGYEVDGGGFEWFGRAPAHADLTAYGLQQFTDMQEVWSGVDGAMVERTARWLMDQRDGQGGYIRSAKSLDRFGGASAEVSAAYITWSLVYAGQTGLKTEIAAAAKRAKASEDPYVVAISALTLLALPERRAEGARAAERLRGMRGEDGAWSGGGTITNSGGQDRAVETTALAVMALLEAQAEGPEVGAGVDYLLSQRRANGSFGGTQATVLALRALLRWGDARSSDSGSVTLLIDGEEVETLSWDPAMRGVVEGEALGERLAGGAHQIELVGDGAEGVPYALGASWRALTPPSAEDAPVQVDAELAESELAMGEMTELRVVLRNTEDAPVTTPIARVGFPAGLALEPWSADEAVNQGKIAFYETGAREVVVYLDGLDAGERRELVFHLAARIPGETVGPPSTAYPYYQSEAAWWDPGLAVKVTP